MWKSCRAEIAVDETGSSARFAVRRGRCEGVDARRGSPGARVRQCNSLLVVVVFTLVVVVFALIVVVLRVGGR